MSASELHDELGDLDVLAELNEDESADLLAMIRTARTTQNKALDDAINEVLHHLPRLVRGPARKIVFG